MLKADVIIRGFKSVPAHFGGDFFRAYDNYYISNSLHLRRLIREEPHNMLQFY